MVTQKPLAPINPDYRQDVRQDVYSSETGDIIVRWPARLAPQEYGDIRFWMQALADKMGRAALPENEDTKP